jgi:hypothetical protein
LWDERCTKTLHKKLHIKFPTKGILEGKEIGIEDQRVIELREIQ